MWIVPYYAKTQKRLKHTDKTQKKNISSTRCAALTAGWSTLFQICSTKKKKMVLFFRGGVNVSCFQLLWHFSCRSRSSGPFWFLESSHETRMQLLVCAEVQSPQLRSRRPGLHDVAPPSCCEGFASAWTFNLSSKHRRLGGQTLQRLPWHRVWAIALEASASFLSWNGRTSHGGREVRMCVTAWHVGLHKRVSVRAHTGGWMCLKCGFFPVMWCTTRLSLLFVLITERFTLF